MRPGSARSNDRSAPLANGANFAACVTILLGTAARSGQRARASDFSGISGGSAATTANLTPGAYVFYCSVDAHRAGGMQGTLTVK
jgi:plastocyanin